MKAHVLIVDDESGPREALEFALGKKNPYWTLSTASSVEQARTLLTAPAGDAGPIDLVLTDLVISNNKGGGIDVLEIAKRHDPFTMVILFTAQEKELDRFEAYRLGAFDCVEKNLLGRSAWREISVKANAALNFRQQGLSHVSDQQRLTTLRRFFDPRVLAAVEKDPGILAVRMRRPTILYWDIRGFSNLCQALIDRPDVLNGFLFDYYSTATDCIFRHGGILDKYMGDVVMALFCDLGQQESNDQDMANAVAAAQSMRRSFSAVRRKWAVQWPANARDLSIGLAAALHTGNSLVGNLGTTHREQFTAIGPHVNLASRLLRQVGPDQIVVTESVARGLPPGHDLRSAGTLQAANAELEPLQVFRVEDAES